MARAQSLSFVAEFPLRTTLADKRALSVSLDAARQVYNACLGEALRRLDRMRESKAWQAARALPKTVGQKPNPARSAAFRAVEGRFEFGAASLQRFAESCRDACWIGDHLGSHDTQTTSLRAFRAVRAHALGKRGRPRFKRAGGLTSIEGKEDAVLRYRAAPVPAVHYRGLVLPLVLDARDQRGWEASALAGRVKYVRILKRSVRGKTRWQAQLVMEGVPPVKAHHRAPEGVAGLDLGPSTIAVVSEHEATLEAFSPTVTQPWKELRRIERALDRSPRATNPRHFNLNGTVKKGRKTWTRSRRYQRLAEKRRERERRLASERKRSHGALANRVLAQGKTVKAEKLSYRAFQRRFGRSVKVRAPGSFMAILQRKVQAAGGCFVDINPNATRLSQFDHTTGQYVKKPLSQRLHVFGDGVTAPVQRDLYSAFLASCCDAETLDVRQVQRAWPDAEPLLRRAMTREIQPASGVATLPAPTGRSPSELGRPSKKAREPGRGHGGCSARESRGESGKTAFRIPWL